MLLEQVANICYAPRTASEDRPITVKTHIDNRVLWSGKAKELAEWVKEKNCGWIVVEILIDTSDNRIVPDYNKGKIITVI